MEEEPDFDENGDSNRTMFSDAEGSAKSIFFAFQKQTDEIIKQNRKFFESLRDVMDIETIGHSLNEIDLPYFKEISKYAKGAVWVVYYHKSEEKSKMAEQLLKCGVPPERIKLTPLKP
jgi:adenylate cyclase